MASNTALNLTPHQTHPSCCQMEEYTLNCLVPGAKDTFSVKIKKDQSVDDLKKVIKKKNEPRFNHFDADELTLHQINVDVSNESEYVNIMLEVSQPGYVFIPKKKLHPMQEISEHFEDSDPPKRKTIHILVEPPQSKSIDPRACGAVVENMARWC